MKTIYRLLAFILIIILLLQIIPIQVTIDTSINQTILLQIAPVTSGDTIEEEKEEKVAEIVIEKNYVLTTTSDLRVKSNITASEYDKMLERTALLGIGEALEKAEQEYSVNGLYLMGLCIVESGWGTSSFAVNRNNLVGFNAVDSNPGKATTFESKEQCIMAVAKLLQKSYLTENGAYFEGYTAKDIDVHYCTDKLHANKIVNTVNGCLKKL